MKRNNLKRFFSAVLASKVFKQTGNFYKTFSQPMYTKKIKFTCALLTFYPLLLIAGA